MNGGSRRGVDGWETVNARFFKNAATAADQISIRDFISHRFLGIPYVYITHCVLTWSGRREDASTPCTW